MVAGTARRPDEFTVANCADEHVGGRYRVKAVEHEPAIGNVQGPQYREHGFGIERPRHVQFQAFQDQRALAVQEVRNVIFHPTGIPLDNGPEARRRRGSSNFSCRN